MINGVTWPIPKKNKKIIDISGFLACDTQAKRVAKTGVMQGEEASPKVVPMAKGAINVGILSSIIFISLKLSETLPKRMFPRGKGFAAV